MSWESTLLYYELINKKVKAKLEGLHSANCVLESVDFSEIADLQKRNDWRGLERIMIARAKLLEASGAELILICANTMHLCVEAIENSISVPIIHIAKATAEEINSYKLKRVALLGTKFTMENDFFIEILAEKGIETLIPGPEDRELIHEIIYKELVLGIFRKESSTKYLNIIKAMKKQGAEGIILGCTEIPLLIKSEDVDMPLFNTTKIHAEKAVEFAFLRD